MWEIQKPLKNLKLVILNEFALSVIGAMFKEKENLLFYWRKAQQDWVVATTPQPSRELRVIETVVVLPVSWGSE